MNLLTDGQLLVRYRETGEPAAVELLFQRTRPKIARLARRLGVPESDREDFVHDVFLSALVQVGRYDPGRSFQAWVLGIAWRRILASRRRFLQRQLPPGALEVGARPTPLDEVERAEIERIIAESVSRLPESYRDILNLYLLERLSASEIAQRLNRPPSTIRTQIARGLERLRDRLPLGLSLSVLLLMRLRDGASHAPLPFPIGLRGVPLRALSLGAAVAVAAFIGLALRHAGSEAPIESRSVNLPHEASSEVRHSDAEEMPSHTAPDTPVSLAAGTIPAEEREVPSDPPRSSNVRLRFVDKESLAPVPHFVFVCEPWHDGAGELAPPGEARGGVADEHGEALLSNFPSGPMRVRFSAATGSSVYEIDGDTDLTVTVPYTVEVAGNVLDDRSAPVEGADVWVDEVVAGSFQRAFVTLQTDGDGSFRLRFALNSRKRIWAERVGRGRTHVELVNLYPPPAHELRLVLEPAPRSLVGRVARSDGAIEPRALVVLFDPTAARRDRLLLRTDSQADGSFSFETLTSDRRYEIVAIGTDGSVGRTSIEAAQDARTPCEVVLVPGATVHGRAQESDGRPTAGAIVAAVPLEAEPQSWELWRTAVCGADGSFELVNVPPGRVELLLVDPGSNVVLTREKFEATSNDVLEWNPLHGVGGDVDQTNPLRRYLAWRKDPSAPRGAAGALFTPPAGESDR